MRYLSTFPSTANPKFSAISSLRHPAPHAQKGTTARKAAHRKFQNVTRERGAPSVIRDIPTRNITDIFLFFILRQELNGRCEFRKPYYHGGENDNIQACCVGRRWRRKGMSACSPLDPFSIVGVPCCVPVVSSSVKPEFLFRLASLPSSLLSQKP